LPDILRAGIFAIARGYEDAHDLDRRRLDPDLPARQRGQLPDIGASAPAASAPASKRRQKGLDICLAVS
jgi:hypothetical protein